MKKSLLWALSGSFLAACATQPQATPVVSTEFPYMMSHDRHPTSVTVNDNGSYTVSDNAGSQYAGQTVKFYVNGVERSTKNKVKADGSFEHTFEEGVGPGDNIVYRVGSYSGSSTVPKASSSGSSSGSSNFPVPPSQNPAPPISLPQIEISKVRDNADTDARCTANAVVAHYGRIENFRYHYYLGFRQGLNVANNINGIVGNSAEYQMAFRNGQVDGYQAGRTAGTSAGANDGSTQAVNDVFNMYYHIVDSGSAPSYDKHDRAPQSGGLSINLVTPTIADRMVDATTKYKTELGNVLASDDYYSGQTDFDDSWSLVNYYNRPSYDFGANIYSSDAAWDNFHNARFSRCSDKAKYYDKISDSSAYSNASDAGSTYISTFKRTFRNVIDSKWNAAVQAMDQTGSQAQQLGLTDGVAIYQSYARDLGRDQGYMPAYTQGSKETYNDSYTTSYDDKWGDEVHKYDTSAVIRVEAVSLVDETGKGTSHLVTGLPVGVQLLSVKNLGRIAADVPVTLTGDVESQTKKMIHVEPSASVKGAPIESALGVVSRSVKPNDNAKIRINIGSASKDETFKNDFVMLCKLFSWQPAGPTESLQQKYIFDNVWAETSAKYNGGWMAKDPWAKASRDHNLLLVSMLDGYVGVPADHHANIGKVVSSVKGSLGARPTSWNPLDAKKGRWDSITSLLGDFK